MFRQLVATGLLRVDVTGYGALQLNETSRPVLRGEQSVLFRQEVEVEKKKAPKTRSKVPLDLPADRHELLEALRALRRKLSEEQGVPSFVIFHDSTLMQLVHAASAEPRAACGNQRHRRAKIGTLRRARCWTCCEPMPHNHVLRTCHPERSEGSVF